MDTFKMMGIQLGENTITSFMNENHIQNFTVSRRAVFPAYWTAIDSNQMHRGAYQAMDKLYLIVRRYKFDSPLEVKRKRDASTKDIINGYWQLMPYVSTNQQPPPAALYSSFDYEGDYLYVGWVHFVDGVQRSKSSTHRQKARTALCPERLGADDWREGFYSLPMVTSFVRD